MKHLARTLLAVLSALATGLVFCPAANAQQTQSAKLVYNDRRLHGVSMENVDDADLYKALADRLIPKFSSLYRATLAFEEIPHVTAGEIQKTCAATGASGAIILVIGMMGKGNFKMNAELDLTIVGRDGIRSFKAAKSGGRGYSRFTFDVARDQLVELGDQLYDAAAAEAAAQPQATSNLIRYGIYMADAQKDAFFRLEPSEDGATVSELWPQGTAARAGVMPGDTVTEINGRSTKGLTKAELDAIASSGAEPFVLGVRMADGKTTTFRFQPRSAAWYAAHRK